MLEIFKQVEAVAEKNFDESLVSLWIKFADVRPSSQKTYTKALKQMFKYFRENLIQYPVREDIEKWKSEMFKTKNASTIQLYIIAAKLFFKFLSQEKIYPNITDKHQYNFNLYAQHRVNEK